MTKLEELKAAYWVAADAAIAAYAAAADVRTAQAAQAAYAAARDAYEAELKKTQEENSNDI
jgi:uncharacterized membrane protein